MFWQAHPFTIVSSAAEENFNQLVLIIRVKQGLTKNLAEYIATKPNHEAYVPLLVEGPYGSTIPFKAYEHSVFVAGGVGMTVVYTLALYLAQTYRAQILRGQKVRTDKSISIVWVAPNFESLMSFKREIESIQRFEGLVELQVFITRDLVEPELKWVADQEAKTEDERLVNEMFGDCKLALAEKVDFLQRLVRDEVCYVSLNLDQKPDLCRELSSYIAGLRGPTAVIACGPASMNADVRHSTNEATAVAVSRSKQAVERLRYEYALLLEALGRKADEVSIPNVGKLTADDLDGDEIDSLRLADITHLLTKTPFSLAKNGFSASVGSLVAKKKRGANTLKKQRLKDPTIPKRPTNAYLIFCEMEKERVKKQIESKDPGVPSDLSKAMTEAWRNLDDVSRKPYYELYEQDRLRYQREIKEYNSKQKNGKAGDLKKDLDEPDHDDEVTEMDVNDDDDDEVDEDDDELDSMALNEDEEVSFKEERM
ncbi:hypothetical protein KL918_002589 [Ogataea parapolymorpha]|nr:hypothetical protein KL918_002589 [Ogataea parapolymorpha]KAG7870850.1 hypothetical protein KL916_004581 [Ogataea parapolymorpha]